VDLGSNSFRLLIAKEEGGQIVPTSTNREGVRLGSVRGFVDAPAGTVMVVPTLVIMLVALGVVSYVPEMSTGLVFALRNEAKVEALPTTPTANTPAEPTGEKSLQDLMKANKLPIGQPMPIEPPPAALRPAWKAVMPPATMQMIANEIAKFEKPLMRRSNSCA